MSNSIIVGVGQFGGPTGVVYSNPQILDVTSSAFGAVGDGAADCTAAIQNAIRSFDSSGSTGGTVYLPYGKYKITSSIIIDRAVRIIGSGGSRFYPGTEIQCPPGVTAFKIYNQPSSPTARGADWTSISDIKIRQTSQNRTTTTGSRTTNTTTVTVSNNQDFAIGNIIGIHGAGEASILQNATATTSAGSPNFTINNSINGLSIGANGFYSMTGIGQVLDVAGAGFPAGSYVTGISGTTITMSQNAANTVSGAAITTYEDLYAQILNIVGTTWTIDNIGGFGPSVTSAHIYHADCGVYAKTRYRGTNISVEGFNGPGFLFYGQDIDPGAPNANTNNWCLDFCTAYNNSHGIYLYGDSGNAGLAMMCDVLGNRSYGINDASALGNTYLMCHVSGGQGYRVVHDSVTRATFLGCYTEGGAYNSFASATFVIGGVMGPNDGGTEFTSQNSIGLMNQLRVGDSTTGAKFSPYQVDLNSPAAAALILNGNGSTFPGTLPQYIRKSPHSAGLGWWGVTANGAADGYSFFWSDADVATYGKGHFWLPRGFHIGTASDNTPDIAQSRQVVIGNAAPSTGTWAQGDRCLNNTPTEQGSAGSKYVITGWICTSGGTPGTWLQMRCLTGN